MWWSFAPTAHRENTWTEITELEIELAIAAQTGVSRTSAHVVPMMLLGKCPLPFQSFDAEELIETSLWKVSKKGVHFEDAIHVDDDGVLLKNVTNLGREANVVAYEPLFDLRIDPTRFNFTPPASE